MVGSRRMTQQVGCIFLDCSNQVEIATNDTKLEIEKVD
jgi:hypothetical protein